MENTEKVERQVYNLRLFQSLVKDAEDNYKEYLEFLAKSGWEFQILTPFHPTPEEGWIKVETFQDERGVPLVRWGYPPQ